MSEWKQELNHLFRFIDKSPCAFHAVAQLEQRLSAHGFQELREQEGWQIEAGGKYYVKRNGSSLIAFVLPEKEPRGFHIVASHTDSPSFKVKTNPEIGHKDSCVRLNVEKYGGMIYSTWLDRPLSVAGRVFVEAESGEIESHLVNIDRDLLVIPNLAIHMNGELNKGYVYNPQVDLLPFFSEKQERKLSDVVAEELGVDREKVLSEELFLYARQKGSLIGADGEWIASPRLDDLQCAYASQEGILAAAPEKYISLCAFFDNEEVGSGTKQGADSDFLKRAAGRILAGLKIGEEKRETMLPESFLISADNAHALHPAHPEKADPTNRPKLNGGMAMKLHGGQKYTTDGYSAAVLRKLCREAEVKLQAYCNRSDISGGSTLGNISASQISVPSVDIGFPQLAMHSAVEFAGSRDLPEGIRLFRYFLSL